LSNRSNRDCPGCIDARHRKVNEEFLTLEDVEKAIKFAKKGGITKINLTGGEPTVHPKIVEIAKLFHEAGFETRLYTNYDNKNIVKQLDGIVDYVFVSYYGQEMPDQKDFQSDVTIVTLLYKDYFKTLTDLNNFIDKYSKQSDLIFKAPVSVNDYVKENIAGFLSEIDSEFFIRPNGSKVQIYKGCLVVRPDLENEFYSVELLTWKMHPNGKISRYWSEAAEKLAQAKKKN